MPSGASVRDRVRSALTRVRASDRDVYLRTESVVAGNSLLGIGVEVEAADTLIETPPVARQVTFDEVQTSGGLYQPGDYRFVFDGSVDEHALLTSLIVYGDEVLQVVRVDRSVFGGVVVAWRVTARSRKPGETS